MKNQGGKLTFGQKAGTNNAVLSNVTSATAAPSTGRLYAATMPPHSEVPPNSMALQRKSQFAAQHELSKQFGVMCADTVTWKLWSVGGEYERRLTIKNTHDKLQVISYKLPRQKATFFVDFPEPVSLSSGMSHSLSIRFRPSELVEYNDEMEICVRGRGSFFIKLVALTPYAHLTTPEKHDFELCPVHVATSFTFPIVNSGTVPLAVTWEVPQPFTIEPKRISLEEGQQTNVTVTFLPTDAKPVVAQAVCRIDESGDAIAFVRFSGISKFGFLQLKEGGRLLGGDTTSASKGAASGKLSVDAQPSANIACSGTGRDVTVDFGPLLTSTRTTRYLTLVNPSEVDVDYQIKRLDKDITGAFFISPLAATVPRRGGEVRLAIRFDPKNTGAHYASSYIVESISCGSLLRFQCSGEAVGPEVALSASAIDFGDVDVDALCGDDLVRAANPVAAETPITMDKHVGLRNLSSIPLKFQFIGATPGGAFALTPAGGTIGAKTSMNVKITFAPDAPVNYLKRLYLLTSHADSALILDVFGTAFTSKTRPAPFNARGVQLYFSKVERGLGCLPPSELERLLGMLREGIDATTEKDASAMVALTDVLSSAPGQVGTDTPLTAGSTSKSNAASAAGAAKARRKAQLAMVFPGERSRGMYPFAIDTPLITIRHENRREPQTVVIRNTSSAKATANWSLPVDARVQGAARKDGKAVGSSLDASSDMASFWRISPSSADIAPNSTATFQVSLDPNAPPASFGCFLECFVTYKTMRSFRLVTDDSFIPSQCLLLQCTHLAPYRENGPTPHVQLPTAVAFPPCEEGKSVYQVLDLHNSGNTAQAYDIHVEATMLRDTLSGGVADASMYKTIDYTNASNGSEPNTYPSVQTVDDIAMDQERKKMMAGVFTCYPASGIIPPNGSALVLVKFSPPLRSQFLGAAHVAFNGAAVPSANAILKGESFMPTVSLEANSRLTFRPTTVGGTCTREYVITNRSRIAVDFEINVPEEFANIFQLSPMSGTLAGCRDLRLIATFTPDSVGKFETLIPVSIASAGDFATNAAPTTLRLAATGAGEVGLLSLEPLSVVVPSVGVGSFVQRNLTIFNTGLSDTAFQLRCLSKRQGGSVCNNGLNDDDPLLPEVQFGPSSSGIVRARAHHNVSVRVRLPTRGTYVISVFALSHGSLDILETSPNPTQNEMRRMPVCTFTVTGEHPVVQVGDVRCVHQQKSKLWSQMNIPHLNAKLSEPLGELDNRIRPMLFDEVIGELSGVNCHLGTDVFHAAPLRILMALTNEGCSPVAFDFRLPLDNEITKEPWHADQRGLDDPIAAVMDKGLFDVLPRSGVIEPYSHTVVTVQYCHSAIGTHTIPAILRINDGKQVLVNLSATTNAPSTKMLAFHQGMRHELQKVAIGDLDPPLQYTEVQNLSSCPIDFSIDDRAFAELKEANYDFPILQGLNQRGTIPPMSTLLLSWYFRPLEAKVYEVPLLVSVEGGDTYDLTIVGRGYHPKHMTKEALVQLHTSGLSDIPAVPIIEHLSLPMRLSMDVVRFGTVPFHTLHRRHIHLSNTHPTDTYLFEWHSVLQHGDQVFEVEPPSGQLLPGETIHFRVSLYAGSTSHILDTSVHCHVLNESLRLRRKAIMDRKEHAAALSLNRQNADALSATSSRMVGAERVRGTGPRPRLPVTTVPPKFQSLKRLHRTVQALEDAAIAEEVDEDADEWAHVAVAPTVVELIVQARIMPIDAFTDIFGEEAAASMFYPTLLGTRYPGDVFPPATVGPARTPTPLVGSSTAAERMVAEGCLMEMLKRVVHNVAVQEALLDPREDPVPYFCEAIATSIMGDDKDSAQLRAESALCDMVVDERDVEGAEACTSDYRERSSGATSEGMGSPATAFTRVVPKAAEPVSGEVQCIVEEVLEDVLFGLVAAALAESGVVGSAVNEKKRAFALRRETGARLSLMQ